MFVQDPFANSHMKMGGSRYQISRDVDDEVIPYSQEPVCDSIEKPDAQDQDPMIERSIVKNSSTPESPRRMHVEKQVLIESHLFASG
jgi:hypothetical protein